MMNISIPVWKQSRIYYLSFVCNHLYTWIYIWMLSFLMSVWYSIVWHHSLVYWCMCRLFSVFCYFCAHCGKQSFTYVFVVLSPKICFFYILYGDTLNIWTLIGSLGTYICFWEFTICMTLELNKCALGMVVRELTRKVALCWVILDFLRFLKVI